MVRAALVQFPPGRVSIYRLPQIRSIEQLKGLVQQLGDKRAIIAYTLVLPEYQLALEEEALRYQIPTVDLLGPLISRLPSHLALTPFSAGTAASFRREIFQADRSRRFCYSLRRRQNPDGIMQAELVLAGVSRTSKTPNCMYLAHHYGLKLLTYL